MPAVETISNIFLGFSIIMILSAIIFTITRSSFHRDQNKVSGVEKLNPKLLQGINHSENNLQPVIKQNSSTVLLVVGLIFTIFGITLKITP